MHHHASHQNEPITCGSNMCLIESREQENISGYERATIAHHVWESCKPGDNFTVKSPTVSARKVQLTRLHLQNEKTEGDVDAADTDKPCKSPQPSQSKIPSRSSRASICQCGGKKKKSSVDAMFKCQDENEQQKNEVDDDVDDEDDDCGDDY